MESIFSVTLSYTWNILIKRRLVLFAVLNTSGKYIFCNSKLYIGTYCNYKPKFKLSQHKKLFSRYQYERSILDFALNFEKSPLYRYNKKFKLITVA